jgi:hypothetical protein
MKYCFVFVCQQGGLELKSILLAASLKRYLRCNYECVAAIPQPLAKWGTISEDTLALMHDLGVRSVPITNPINEYYPIGNKVACLGIDTPADKLIFLDSDILCVREFSPDTLSPNPSSLFGSIPESVSEMKGIFAAPFNAVAGGVFSRDIKQWQQIYDLFKLPLPQWRIFSPGTNELVMPYFNAGVVVVQNGLGFAEVWKDCCQRIDAEASITNKYPWLDQIALPVAAARLGLTVNVLDIRFNYQVHFWPLPKDLPFLCHYHTSTGIRSEPRLNQLVNELANTYPLLKKRLLNSSWAYLLEPYTLNEKALYSVKRQIKALKSHVKRYFHLTGRKKSSNLLGHSSGPPQ